MGWPGYQFDWIMLIYLSCFWESGFGGRLTVKSQDLDGTDRSAHQKDGRRLVIGPQYGRSTYRYCPLWMGNRSWLRSLQQHECVGPDLDCVHVVVLSQSDGCSG